MDVQDFPVGFPLSSRSHVCHPSWARHGYMDVGSCHCVPTCGIPDEETTLGPRGDGHSVGAFTIGADSPCGSSTDGMLAVARDCLMMVFNWL